MDLIDRQAVINEICYDKCMVKRKFCAHYIPCDDVRIIESAPTVEPKRGECDTCGWHNACNWETLMKDWNIEHGYCAAYCGADMRKRAENDTI